MSSCLYFIAYAYRPHVVKLVSLLRSMEDNCMFDRTFDKANSVLEFFVPLKMLVRFLEIMDIMQAENFIKSFEEKDISESSIYG